MGEAVLVFPGGTPDGLAYREQARARGLRVIGASSLEVDPARRSYELWETLPYINDPGFDAAFAEVVRRHGIDAVHAPHYLIWKHLSERLADLAPGASLSHGVRPEDHKRAYEALQTRMADTKPPSFWPAFPPQPPLSGLERTGLVRLIDSIPGMCAETKMLSVIEMMRHAPEGDVVEIGSWYGRSAAMFVWLARRFRVGKVLCVDPWDVTAMAQGDPIVDAASAEEDTEAALRIFQINLAPMAQGDLNYLRARSVDGAAQYRPGLTVTTDAFGTTSYAGRIAVLHIDGNHSEADALADTQAWTPHVVPGGWIIFDDYDWTFGDGPKIVADVFVAENAARIAVSFKAGVALFVQLKR